MDSRWHSSLWRNPIWTSGLFQWPKVYIYRLMASTFSSFLSTRGADKHACCHRLIHMTFLRPQDLWSFPRAPMTTVMIFITTLPNSPNFSFSLLVLFPTFSCSLLLTGRHQMGRLRLLSGVILTTCLGQWCLVCSGWFCGQSWSWNSSKYILTASDSKHLVRLVVIPFCSPFEPKSLTELLVTNKCHFVMPL